MAANTHDAVLGHSLSNVNIVAAPKQPQNKRKTNKHRAAILPAGKRGKTGSVEARLLDIDSVNTLGGSISSRRGASVAIGAADLSRIRADEIQVQTTNTVGQGINAKGDETRFRMGTVDASGLDTDRLNISTENTIEGGVSVKDGQDVSIGVVEMGKSEKAKKGKHKGNVSHGMHQMPDQVIDFIEIGKFGRAVNLKKDENTDTSNDVPEGICIDKIPMCDNSCCQGKIDQNCHTIDGCSAVRDNYVGGNYIFGDPEQGFQDASNNWIPCNGHDQCYQTCGTDREACDIQIYYDMIDTCRRQERDTWDETKVLTTGEINNKINKGIAGEAAAIAVKVPVKSILTSSGYGVFVTYAAGKEIDIIMNQAVPDKKYFEDRLWIGILSAGQPILRTQADKLHKGIQTVTDYSDTLKNDIDKFTVTAKKNVNTSIESAETLLYGMADQIESGGHAIHRLFNNMVDNVAPEKNFFDTVSQPLLNNSPCRGNFLEIAGCEFINIPRKTGNALNSTISGVSWVGQQTASYFTENVGNLADYGGKLLADDERFLVMTGGKPIKYIGNSTINGAGITSKTAIGGVSTGSTATLSITANVMGTTATVFKEAGDLMFDCLATAETYFKGLRWLGGKFFRGDLNPCDDNKVEGDEQCCVVNEKYRYHQSQLIQRDLGKAVPDPIETFCNSAKRNHGGGESW